MVLLLLQPPQLTYQPPHTEPDLSASSVERRSPHVQEYRDVNIPMTNSEIPLVLILQKKLA
jgi:hypothetical protein